ncbi:hypothetical protein BX666DRAFT_1903904, partial [Dichotomocladium elegans]
MYDKVKAWETVTVAPMWDLILLFLVLLWRGSFAFSLLSVKNGDKIKDRSPSASSHNTEALWCLKVFAAPITGMDR